MHLVANSILVGIHISIPISPTVVAGFISHILTTYVLCPYPHVHPQNISRYEVCCKFNKRKLLIEAANYNVKFKLHMCGVKTVYSSWIFKPRTKNTAVFKVGHYKQIALNKRDLGNFCTESLSHKINREISALRISINH